MIGRDARRMTDALDWLSMRPRQESWLSQMYPSHIRTFGDGDGVLISNLQSSSLSRLNKPWIETTYLYDLHHYPMHHRPSPCQRPTKLSQDGVWELQPPAIIVGKERYAVTECTHSAQLARKVKRSVPTPGRRAIAATAAAVALALMEVKIEMPWSRPSGFSTRYLLSEL
jgi:hypothetical protein